MKVILLQDIKSIGRRGEIKTVKSGYARNYLLPKGLAKLATEGSVKVTETQKVEAQKHIEELGDILKTIQNETKKAPLQFKVKAGKKDEVFNSVRANEIKGALMKKYDLQNENIDVKKDHIKELGKQTIPIDFGNGIEGEIFIDIEPEKP